MKKTLILLFLCTVGFAVYAQDIIVLHSGERIEAVVEEVNIDNVRFRRYSNLNGPMHTIMKSDISIIRYANGDTESFVPAGNNRSRSSRGNPSHIESFHNYRNFTTGERVATWALNGLLPGIGSYLIMQDKVGGTVMLGMNLLNITLGTVGYFMIIDSLATTYDDYGEAQMEFTDENRVNIGASLMLAGFTVFAINSIYNIVRSASYNRPAPRRGFNPEAFNFYVVPGKNGIEQMSLSYTIKF